MVLGNNKITGSIPSFFGNFRFLEVIDIKSASLKGTIPAFTLCQQLSQIRLDNNSLSGTLPSGISSLQKLATLTLTNNALSGNIYGLVNGTTQSGLLTVDLSMNQFTGTIPSELFEAASLQTIALMKNCLGGSIPASICEASDLEVVILDGLASAAPCRELILPFGLSTAYYSKTRLQGTLPSCMWNMSLLSTLQVSGNGLRGNLNGVVIPHYSQLSNLVLASNEFSGVIPSSILRWPFQTLDLSENQFMGTIEALDNVSEFALSGQGQLNLNVNRLSGNIPSDLKNSYSGMNILTGNLFQCNKYTLPSKDVAANSYTCGSNELEQATIASSSFIACVIFSLGVVWFYRTYVNSSAQIPSSPQSNFSVDQWIEMSRFTMSPNPATEIISESHDPAFANNSFRSGDAAPPRRQSFIVDWSKSNQDSESGDGGTFNESFDITSLRAQYHKRTKTVSWGDQIERFNRHFNEYLDNKLDQLIYAATGWRMVDERIKTMQNLYRFTRLLQQLRQLNIFLSLSFLVIVFPMYISLSVSINGRSYSTHTYQYGWKATAAFLSGTTPSIMLMTTWLAITGLAVWRAYAVKRQLRYQEMYMRRKSNLLGMFNKSATYLEYLEEKAKGMGKMWKSCFKMTHGFKVAVLTGLLLLTNFVVIISINAGYVSSQLSNEFNGVQKFFIQVSIACLKLLWNFAFIRYLVESLAAYKGDPEDKKVLIYMAMIAFNNVMAPCIATAIGNSSCFKNVFDPPGPISSSYSISICDPIPAFQSDGSIETSCSILQEQNVYSQFSAPFVYSYQCGDAIITSYVPLYSYSYAVLLLLGPVLSVALTFVDVNRIPKFFVKQMSSFLWPQADPALFRCVIDPDIEVFLQLQHVLMLLTFGITSIELTFVIAVSAIISSIATQVLIVRYISQSHLVRTAEENVFRNSTLYRSTESSNTSLCETVVVSFLPVTSQNTTKSIPQGSTEAVDDPSQQAQQAHIASSLNAPSREILSDDDISNSNNNKSNTTITAGYDDLSGGLESACSGSWRRLLNGIAPSYIGASLFYASILFDGAADAEGWQSGLWVPFACAGAPVLLYLFRKFWKDGAALVECAVVIWSKCWSFLSTNRVNKESDGTTSTRNNVAGTVQNATEISSPIPLCNEQEPSPHKHHEPSQRHEPSSHEASVAMKQVVNHASTFVESGKTGEVSGRCDAESLFTEQSLTAEEIRSSTVAVVHNPISRRLH